MCLLRMRYFIIAGVGETQPPGYDWYKCRADAARLAIARQPHRRTALPHRRFSGPTLLNSDRGVVNPLGGEACGDTTARPSYEGPTCDLGRSTYLRGKGAALGAQPLRGVVKNPCSGAKGAKPAEIHPLDPL